MCLLFLYYKNLNFYINPITIVIMNLKLNFKFIYCILFELGFSNLFNLLSIL